MARPFAASEIVDSGQALLPLLDELRFEGAIPVARRGEFYRPDIGQDRLGPGAVAGVAAVLACRIVCVIAEVVGDLAFQD
ncbi:hypothetical protein GCM10009863_35350 [Streptomyces axinellae]|uniref:Uncharacterized protein n=1 Tax=Streptomyces axinellae TaxID=552788 RepID=A0ABN3Q698_9ACTN